MNIRTFFENWTSFACLTYAGTQWAFASLILLLLTGTTLLGQAPKFYPDDPLLRDADTLDTPAKPNPIELSDLYDRFGHIFHDFGSDVWGEAENVNTLDEVPDSSWFTNRHGKQRMSIEQLVEGPDTGSGPDVAGTWTIFRGKAEGITPGFSIVDSKGDRYVIKFGAPDYPELNSASEIIATKILYALGYHTPENYIAFMKPENLRIRDGTEVTDRFGDKILFTEKMLRRGLKVMKREPDGTYRVIASKYVAGEPLGPFRYFGRRTDDPNDLFDHEQRRELRGLRLIAAWINHDDTRAINTLDSWIEEEGRHYVKHFLIDFGSCFGSGTADLQLPNLSFHYWLDTELIKKNAVGFGFHVPKYRKVDWPNYRKFPGVGRFESEHFDPQEWKNDYPNPAFVRMTPRDAFWAAKLIMSFTEKDLEAIVALGQLRTKAEEEYFLETLIERQKKSGAFGLNGLNPLDEFRVQDGRVAFTNLSERFAFSSPGASYQMGWSIYNNKTGTTQELSQSSTSSQPYSGIPQNTLATDSYLVLTIRTQHADFPHWTTPISVYLRPAGDTFVVIGVDR